MANLFTLVLVGLVAMAAASPLHGTCQFAYDLYKNSYAEKPGNIIISPLSVETALSLAYMGAKGETATEIAAAMHYDNPEPSAVAAKFGSLARSFHEGSQVHLANKIYLAKGVTIKPSFMDIAKDFDSETETLDFSQAKASAEKINEWVEHKTENKIKDFITPEALEGVSNMILINAIHFKAKWEKTFTTYRTGKAPFWTSETDKHMVDLMHQKDHFRYVQLPELDAAAIELPYANSDMVMMILLPNTKTGLAQLETGLANLDLDDISRKMADAEVELTMPKFKVEYEIKMKNPLKKMGLNKMFSSTADFTNLLDTAHFKVSEVVHKAFIEVNEEGTEAAAATGMFMVGSAGPGPRRPVITFEINRPFYYQIRDSHSNALFVGSVRNLH